MNDGGWILPNGDHCNSTTSPVQCKDCTNSTYTLQRVAKFDNKELVYKCCVPSDCSGDVIIANIYGEYSTL